MRCSICATNWPFYRQFIECPVCEQVCTPLRFSSSEDILTPDEANEILADHGLSQFRLSQIPRLQVDAMVTGLHNELDAWNRGEVPEWMR